MSSERATGVEQRPDGAPVGVPVRGSPAGSAGVPAALLAVAATGGALVGFGVRERAPARFLTAAGEQLRGVPAFVTPDRGFGIAAVLGIVQHAGVVVAWTLLFTLLARRLRGLPLVGAAVAFAGAVLLVDGVLPDAVRLAAGSLTGPQRVVLVAVLAAAVAVGMRFARIHEGGAARPAGE